MAIQHTQGFLPVASAIAGNALVAVLKFAAAFTSGSSVMFSEAIHSVADTANQILLLIGLGRSTKKADDTFEYGYGNERFFWALISACGVLFLGAGVALYGGFAALLAPKEIEFSALVFGVLAASFAIESYTFAIAARSLQRSFPALSWRERIQAADPSTLSVFLEDAVAVLGIVLAASSITLAYYTGNSAWDAAGSILIGLLLGGVAIVLILKNREYLVGKSLPQSTQEAVVSFIAKSPYVEKVLDVKSSVVAFGVYRIKCEVEFNGAALFRDAYRARGLRAQYESVHGDFEAFKRFCVDYADRIPRLIGRRIDDLEARIKKEHPEIRHIDIEVN